MTGEGLDVLTGGESWEAMSNEQAYKVLMNALLSGYQIALYRTIGDNPALTQILITELGDILMRLDESLKKLIDQADRDDIGNIVIEVVKKLRISDKVEVEKKDSIYHVYIHNSIFEPFAHFMKEKGIRTTLSPEAILVAAVIRSILRHKDPKARVSTRMLQWEPGKPLHIEVKIIGSL